MRLIVVRHGESEGNEEGVFSLENVSLTEKGKEQMRRTGEALRSSKADKIIASDLPRAAQSAEILAEVLGVEEVSLAKDLRECNVGIWKNLPQGEAIKKLQEFEKEEKAEGVEESEIRPPEGENSWDHQKRVMGFVDRMIEGNRGTDRTILLVAHGGTNKVIIGSLMGRKPPNFYDVPQDNACINVIEIENGKRHFRRVNSCDHLR